MAKATAGERLAAKFYGWTIREVKSSPNTLAKCVDHILGIERAKVAEDVLAIAANSYPSISSGRVAEEVRAKYGKGKR